MTRTCILALIATSPLLAPAALAQDASALSSFQTGLDTTYVRSLENTWDTLTTHEPALEALDLSYDEQLDMVEDLVETGSACDDGRSCFDMPDVDVEGILFLELYGELNFGIVGGGLDIQAWLEEGFFAVRTDTGLKAHYSPSAVPGLVELHDNPDTMIMAFDLNAWGLDASDDTLAVFVVEDELLDLPLDEPLLDYSEIVEVEIGEAIVNDYSEYITTEADAVSSSSGSGEGSQSSNSDSDWDGSTDPGDSGYSGTESGSSYGESGTSSEPEASSTGREDGGDDNGRGGSGSTGRSGR